MSNIVINVDHINKYAVNIHHAYLNSINYLMIQFENNMRNALIDAINIYNNITHYNYKFNFDDKALIYIKTLDRRDSNITITIIDKIIDEFKNADYNIVRDKKIIYIMTAI